MMTKILAAASATALLLGCGAAFAQGSSAGAMRNNSPLTHQEKQFLQREARSGAFELALSKAAEQKATNPEIKQFAQLDISDHTTLNQQAEALARQSGVTLPADPTTKEKRRVAHVSSENDRAFDQAYLAAMRKINENDVAHLQTEVNKVRNEQLRQLLLQEQSADRMHAGRAQELTMADNASHSGAPASNAGVSGNTTR